MARANEPKPPVAHAEQGTSDQLPQGEAQAVNQADQQSKEQIQATDKANAEMGAPQTPAPPAPGSADQNLQAAAQETPQWQTVPPDVNPAPPLNEDEHALFGPTNRPNEPVTANANAQIRQNPPDMHLWFPALREAAQDPSAPAQLRTLYQLVIAKLQGQT